MCCRWATACSITPASICWRPSPQAPRIWPPCRPAQRTTSPLPRLLKAARSFPLPTALWKCAAWTRPFTARSSPSTPVPRAWWRAWSRIIWASCCLTISKKSALVRWSPAAASVRASRWATASWVASSALWATPSTAKAPSSPWATTPLRSRPPAFWSARAWIPRCTPAFWPSTPCSPSAAASVS